MATVRRLFDATPTQVWDVLCDGWRYSNWVVGTSHMRSVDDTWPEVGSRLEHATGVWPFVLRDSTEVVECDPEQLLVLVAHGGALGDARIAIEIQATTAGTEVTMSEKPVSGLGRVVDSPVTEALIKRRNVEGLARLAVLAERRTPGSGA